MIALNGRNSSISIQYYSLNTEIVVMQNNSLSKGTTEHIVYESPVCRVILAETQRVICGSLDDSIQGTEVVEEIEGIW